MPAYIILGKYTQQGIASAKESPGRIKQNRAFLEKLGGRHIGFWLTMGEYDYVAINEFPDDQTAASTILAIASRGSSTTMTMRAFSEEEFAQIVGKLP